MKSPTGNPDFSFLLSVWAKLLQAPQAADAPDLSLLPSPRGAGNAWPREADGRPFSSDHLLPHVASFLAGTPRLQAQPLCPSQGKPGEMLGLGHPQGIARVDLAGAGLEGAARHAPG